MFILKLTTANLTNQINTKANGDHSGEELINPATM